jgi:hypothetical protein
MAREGGGGGQRTRRLRAIGKQSFLKERLKMQFAKPFVLCVVKMKPTPLSETVCFRFFASAVNSKTNLKTDKLYDTSLKMRPIPE